MTEIIHGENEDGGQNTNVVCFKLAQEKAKRREKDKINSLCLEFFDDVFNAYERNSNVTTKAVTRLRDMYHESESDDLKLSYMHKMLSISNSEEDLEWVARKALPLLGKMKNFDMLLDIQAVLYKDELVDPKIKAGFHEKFMGFFASRNSFLPIYSIIEGYGCKVKTIEFLAEFLFANLHHVTDKKLKVYFLMAFLKRTSMSDGMLARIKNVIFDLIENRQLTLTECPAMSWSELLEDAEDKIQALTDWLDGKSKNAAKEEVENVVPFKERTSAASN